MDVSAARTRLKTAYHNRLADPAAHRAACIGILVLALAIRLFHVNQPMRLDESRTFLDYALQPLGEALSNYRVPNNHLFHTLLVWLSIRMFGHAEWAVRLPAFIAGALVVPATYVATRVLAGRGAALFAGALAAVLPALILYSTNARGYSIVCLATLILIPLANALANDESGSRWIAFVLLVSVGGYTIPVMLYPAGAVSIWLFAEKTRRHGISSAIRFMPRLASALAAAAALAAIAYAPVILRYGVAAIVRNHFVTALTWPEFFSALPGFAHRIRNTIGLGIPRSVLGGLILIGLLPLVTRRPERMRLRTLAAAAGTWCVVLLIATRRPPPGRVWLFLAPLACVYAGIGLAQIVVRMSRVFRAREQPLTIMAALTLAIGIGTYTVVRRTVFTSDEAVTLVAGPEIARYLLAEAHNDDRVIYLRSTGPQVDYYLFTTAGRRLADMESPSRTGRLLVILNERDKQTIEIVQTRRIDVKWNEFETPVRIQQFESASVYEIRRHP